MPNPVFYIKQREIKENNRMFMYIHTLKIKEIDKKSQYSVTKLAKSKSFMRISEHARV